MRLAQELGPVADALKFRIRGPVGIDIGAVTPEGIALAIVSQIHAWFAGRGGDVAVNSAANSLAAVTRIEVSTPTATNSAP
jgi:xanthine/CO dehydrogenase XdhC/CoxF family maturation factor